MKNILIATVIVVATIMISSIYSMYTSPIGVDNSKFVSSDVLFLSSGITSSQTSITLTKFLVPNTTQKIAMTDFGNVGYITLEPGRTKKELISFTGITQNAGGTATLTGVSRGLSPIAPYTASTTHQQSHSGGVQVIVSNSPQLYADAAFKKNDETVTGTWTFTSTARPIYNVNPTFVDDKELISKKYADDLAIAGAPDASLTVKGIVEIATAIGAASTTAFGGGDTTAPLVLATTLSTSTPGSNVGLQVVMSENDGKLNQLWLDLTEAFTWAGAHIFNSTVDIEADAAAKLTLNTVAYEFPSSQGADGQVLKNDGTGVISWGNAGEFSFATTSPSETATNGTATTTGFLTIPANILTASSTISFKGNFNCDNTSNGDASCIIRLQDSTGATIASATVGTDIANVQNLGFTIDTIGIAPSSQISIGFATTYGGEQGISNNGGASVSNTSSIDFSAGITFIIEVESTGLNTTVSLVNYIIRVTP